MFRPCSRRWRQLGRRTCSSLPLGRPPPAADGPEGDEVEQEPTENGDVELSYVYPFFDAENDDAAGWREAQSEAGEPSVANVAEEGNYSMRRSPYVYLFALTFPLRASGHERVWA